MTLYEMLQNKRAEGVEQGILKEKIATAKRLEEMGLPIEQIAKGSDLPCEDVKKILKKTIN